MSKKRLQLPQPPLVDLTENSGRDVAVVEIKTRTHKFATDAALVV